MRPFLSPRRPRVGATASSSGLLGSGDFTYKGYYDVAEAGLSVPFDRGLTIRRVGGVVHFLTVGASDSNTLRELSLSGKSFGDTITTYTNQGTLPDWAFSQGDGGWANIWWDEDNQRLLSVRGTSYTVSNLPTKIGSHTINGDGTITSIGPIGLQDRPGKRATSGILKVPSAFQAANGVGPYAFGLGDYCSLLGAGGGVNMGFAAYATPDPASYSGGTVKTGSKTYDPPSMANGETITTDVTVTGALVGEYVDEPITFSPLASGVSIRANVVTNGQVQVTFVNNSGSTVDMSSGTLAVSIPVHIPSSSIKTLSEHIDNRGYVLASRENYYDTGGIPAMDGNHRPTEPPIDPQSWPSPDSNGHNVFTYADGYAGGAWIGTRGIVVGGNFVGGKAWYYGSTLHSDYAKGEIHIFDPADLAAVAAGSKAANTVNPVTMIDVSQLGVTAPEVGYLKYYWYAYDEVGKDLYIMQYKGASNYVNRLHVIGVNA